MQLDLTREEVSILCAVFAGVPAHLQPGALIPKLRSAASVSRQVTGCFSWRLPDGSPQVNTALVLVDGKIIDNVAVADTDAGLVVTFEDDRFEGRVEVWMP